MSNTATATGVGRPVRTRVSALGADRARVSEGSRDIGPRHPNPCPVCAAPYGFHDDAPHAAAAARIPAHLKQTISATQLKRERQAERHRLNQLWLPQEGVA